LRLPRRALQVLGDGEHIVVIAEQATGDRLELSADVSRTLFKALEALDQVVTDSCRIFDNDIIKAGTIFR
jgi:hypothetical protein